MENIILSLILLLLGTVLAILIVYSQSKKQKELIKLIEKRLEIKLKAEIESYKGYEIKVFVSGEKEFKLKLNIEYKKKIPLIITNQKGFLIGFFDKGKLYYKKLKLPLKDINFYVFAIDEEKAKKFLYSNQNLINEINYLVSLIEESKSIFLLKSERLELKFPDTRLVTKEIIDAGIRIINAI